MQVSFQAQTLNPIPTWPQDKAVFPAALCTCSHGAKSLGKQDSLFPRRCRLCLRAWEAPSSIAPSTKGWALLPWTSYCTKANSMGMHKPWLFLLSSLTRLAGCHQSTALLRMEQGGKGERRGCGPAPSVSLTARAGYGMCAPVGACVLRALCPRELQVTVSCEDGGN